MSSGPNPEDASDGDMSQPATETEILAHRGNEIEWRANVVEHKNVEEDEERILQGALSSDSSLEWVSRDNRVGLGGGIDEQCFRLRTFET